VSEFEQLRPTNSKVTEVWVNPELVSSMEESMDGTSVVVSMSNGHTFHVKDATILVVRSRLGL